MLEVLIVVELVVLGFQQGRLFFPFGTFLSLGVSWLNGVYTHHLPSPARALHRLFASYTAPLLVIVGVTWKQRGTNPVYNVLPDIVGRLSVDETLDPHEYQEIMGEV